MVAPSPRLRIKTSTKEAWIDGRKLDLTPEAFHTLLVLAEALVAGGDGFVSEADLAERVGKLNATLGGR